MPLHTLLLLFNALDERRAFGPTATVRFPDAISCRDADDRQRRCVGMRRSRRGGDVRASVDAAAVAARGAPNLPVSC